MITRVDNNFPVEKVLESEEFPYAVGSLQARCRNIPKNNYAITEQDFWVADRTRKILEETLQSPVYDGKLIDKNRMFKIKRRVVVWNKALMDFLRECTQNNTVVPVFIRGQRAKRRNYIRGFLDCRSSVTYSTYYVRMRDYNIRFPRLIVTKNSHRRLLDSFGNLLNEEEIGVNIGSSSLTIQRQTDIRRVLKKNLISSPIKLNFLRCLYEELRGYQLEA